MLQNLHVKNLALIEETEVEFSNGLNLIIGNGGKGKSKLFNAFYWVLFGKIYH